MRAEVYPIDGVPIGHLSIMPRPRAGDWLPGEVISWHESGMNVVVSLLQDDEVFELGLEQEADLCQRAGLQFLRFPIPDRGVPASQGELLVLVESLVVRLREGCGVGIHCRIGVGRSAIVAACVLVALGQTIESAWLSIERSRGLSVPDTAEQREWVAGWVDWFNGRPSGVSSSNR